MVIVVQNDNNSRRAMNWNIPDACSDESLQK